MTEPYTKELYEEWKFHPVTQRLMLMLHQDRENMKEGLVHNAFTDESEVKGRCRAIGILLNLGYEDLAPETERKVLDD
jgi:hypothetical protein